jgi:DNA cross-link repair 1A protein
VFSSLLADYYNQSSNLYFGCWLSFVNADYQGLTKSFNHGKIYCSSVTARLVNMNIGIPYDKLHILPLNQKVEIAGIGVTCLDANHCPGSIIILFEPPNGKVRLGLTS